MGLTMSLSGMFNIGHDVGGFAGPVPDAELLVRWVQNGVFSPRFIMNSWKPGGEVNTPWLHPEAIAPIRAAIRFRYRLMPYLYTLFRRAHALGEPMLRPLFYEFEHDPRAFADSDDFMFGRTCWSPMCSSRVRANAASTFRVTTTAGMTITRDDISRVDRRSSCRRRSITSRCLRAEGRSCR